MALIISFASGGELHVEFPDQSHTILLPPTPNGFYFLHELLKNQLAMRNAPIATAALPTQYQVDELVAQFKAKKRELDFPGINLDEDFDL